jgi:excinuclease UvrABC ATPase subunit
VADDVLLVEVDEADAVDVLDDLQRLDLGPEGGVKGGAVVATATPEALVDCVDSHTGAALQAVLARQRPAPRAEAQAA